ncbi:MAG: efflux RND transporter periplasmic adaptor subunit [Gemmatimonadetes bacterium]|nr:efflux RND transporter periplasmic adaptor subunit [Gemmatimonadota bacterium]NIO31785.1 efflux RND transporter periplasmic adaptor subunit [Gemmatimonadota bacterium]
MGFSRRTLGIASVVIILLGALGGIYIRLRALQAEEENGGVEAAEGEGQEVESAQAFRSDIAIPVGAAPVLRDTLVMSVSAAGQAQAFARTLLAAEVEGPVTQVLVREGDWVRQGQVLARIDPERFAFELERARAQLETAEATFAELTLFDDEIADEELRAERRRLARARSGLASAEVGVREAELNVERATVRAPFAGAVANLVIVPGDRLSQRDSIAEIVDLSRIKIEVQALETEVPYLEEGREARVTLSAFPDAVLTGRVVSINPVVDPRTRTARVTVMLPNPDGAVKPGMYARVRIAARLFANRTMVPRGSILERDNRTLVFLFEREGNSSQGLAKWTYVTTGLENEEFVEIVPGEGTTMLEPGQLVLTDGHYTLIHDARVRIVEDVAEARG